MRSRAISGTIATVGGFGAGQVLRLLSNLILTRLLFPEAFGLMSIVNLFIQGVTMFSDIGLTPAIVQHRDGAKESFLNAAWTIQIVRGFALWGILCLLAWPIATFYGERQLLFMLPVGAAAAAISGFRSMAVASLSRKLILGRQALVDLIAQALSILVMVTWAYFHRSVWALVGGGLVTAGASVLLSHLMLPGIRHRLCWDEEPRRQLFQFGRWITVSTAFTFLATQGDRAVLSTFVSVGVIGIYSVAANLSQAMQNVVQRLSSTVLFPIYATWGRESPEKLRTQLYRVRMRTIWWFLFPPCALAVFGEPLIYFLYDHRYHDAGGMLPLMCVSIALHILIITVDPVLLATGDSFGHMVLTTSKGTVVFAAMAVGGYVGGVQGVLIGSIVGRALQYPLLAAMIRKHGVWMPSIDALAVLSCAAVVVGGRALVALVLP